MVKRFSLRRPTAPQERSGRKKSAFCVRIDVIGGRIDKSRVTGGRSGGEPRGGSDSLKSGQNAKEIRANGRKSRRILHLT
jgi:hypothetical protein